MRYTPRYEVVQPGFDECRLEAGLTFKDLSRMTGISKSFLIEFSQGQELFAQKQMVAMGKIPEFNNAKWWRLIEEDEYRERGISTRARGPYVMKVDAFEQIRIDKRLMSLRAIAELTDISITTLSYWQRGYGATMRMALKLCDALGVRFDDLWTMNKAYKKRRA